MRDLRVNIHNETDGLHRFQIVDFAQYPKRTVINSQIGFVNYDECNQAAMDAIIQLEKHGADEVVQARLPFGLSSLKRMIVGGQ